MFVLDKLLSRGLQFVLGTVATAVDSERNEDDDVLRKRLLDAQMQLELGDIDEKTYDAIERDVLSKIRKRHEDGESPRGPLSDVRGAEVVIEGIGREGLPEVGQRREKARGRRKRRK